MNGQQEPRRAFLRSACRHCLGLAALGGVAGAKAQQGAASPLPAARLERPAVDTDEGGWWASMDREEQRLRRSPHTVRDPALNEYLHKLLCKLGGEHCKDVRVQVTRMPQFNAFMYPNGLMQVWTGLLLRMENEAQLAAVLGHELGHFFDKHHIQRMRDLKSKSGAAVVLSMFGAVGALAGLGVLASATAFSRDQELRADQLGVQMMRAAGYDPREAATVWDNLLGELKITGGEDVGKRSAMFATHPPVTNRRDELLKLAGDGGGQAGGDEFARVLEPHRFEWLQAEVLRGQYEESLVLFNRMLKRSPDDMLVRFARGEVYRLRDSAEDQALAVADLTEAAKSPAPVPETFRSLGLVFKRRSDGPAAAAAFERYLQLAPTAGDAGLIKTYLSEIKP